MDERQPQRVLVVDDNEANRYAVSRMLRAAGLETFEATSGREKRVQRARGEAVGSAWPRADGWRG